MSTAALHQFSYLIATCFGVLVVSPLLVRYVHRVLCEVIA